MKTYLPSQIHAIEQLTDAVEERPKQAERFAHELSQARLALVELRKLAGMRQRWHMPDKPTSYRTGMSLAELRELNKGVPDIRDVLNEKLKPSVWRTMSRTNDEMSELVDAFDKRFVDAAHTTTRDMRTSEPLSDAEIDAIMEQLSPRGRRPVIPANRHARSGYAPASRVYVLNWKTGEVTTRGR